MASEALQQVATGNLQINQSTLKAKMKWEILLVSYNTMIEDLRSVLGQIQESSSSVASSSEELAASAEAKYVCIRTSFKDDSR